VAALAVSVGLEQVWDAVEGDSRWGSLVCGEHGCRGQSAHAVFLIELVHGFEQTGAALRVVEPVEEIEGVQTVGDESVEIYANKVWLVVSGATGAVGPEPTESGNECLVVLALTQAHFPVPSARGTPKRLTGAFWPRGTENPTARPMLLAHNLPERRRIAAL